MPDIAGQSPLGLTILALAAFVGGMVRGFSGFGTALIFLPIAGQFLTPFGALIALTLMDVFGPLPNLRRAWQEVSKPDLARLVFGCALVLPVGLWLLTQVPPEVFRYAVSLIALSMVAILILGLRYHGTVTRGMVTFIGGIAGFLGGIAGIPGPAVILFYMARPVPVAVIRATILLFLFAFDFLILGYLGLMGQLSWAAAAVGLILAIPNLVGNWLGGWLFDPAKERVYRGVSYVAIVLAALSGLPLWG